MDGLKPPIVVAGCGPGSRLYLTRAVEEAVSAAELLAGAQRLLDLFPESRAKRLPFAGSVDAWLEQVHRAPEQAIVVLVSGDPGVCSLGRRILGRFGRHRCRVIPGVSSVQLACGLLGLAWEHAAILDAHGALPEVALRDWTARDMSSRDPWVILSGAQGAEALAARLAVLSTRHCFVCEDLSLPTERVALTAPDELVRLPQHPRRLVVLTRESCHD